MNSTKHLIFSIFFALFIIILGTVGYMLLEGWDILDSLYMTIISLATVGYGEVHKLGTIGRLFTIFLILMGVSYFVYVAGALVQFMVEGRIRIILGRRRLDNKIKRLKNHYIVCGYGRIGRVLCQNMRGKPVDLVVIENNEERVSSMDKDGVLYIAGDASDETNLLRAGIKEARGVIAVLGSDVENVFLVLTTRQLNPEIYIMARASRKESRAKLRAAGANQVESPYDTGAIAMAQRIIRPTVTGFLDLALTYKEAEIQMEEIPVGAQSKLVNVMLKESGIRQKFDLIIIAVKSIDGKMSFNPSFETTLKAGDTVIAIGEEKNLAKLDAVLNP
jgi:voltage-gated potassium channel